MAKKEKEEKGLIEIVAKIINTKRSAVCISPSWVATEGMTKLEALGLRKSKPLVYLGCHLQLRQIARGILREQFEPDDESEGIASPSSLFPELQWRYPVARQADEEPQYVLLESMTDEDCQYNIDRLRSDAQSRLRHADSLETWWRARKAA